MTGAKSDVGVTQLPQGARGLARLAHDVPQILELLNAYEAAHSPEAMAYDPENIWRDVIQHLPGFDAERTYQLTDCDRFMLTDGTVIRWHSGRSPLWQVDGNETSTKGEGVT